MTKLYLNEAVIQNSIIPTLNTAINNLNQAVNGVGTLKIPEDFVYAYYLKQLCNKNFNSMQTLRDKKQKLEDSINNYKTIEKVGIEKYTDIRMLQIPTRNVFKK